MAITVNLKPAGFQPVAGGQLIYKFTEGAGSPGNNYRIELEFNGLGLPKFQFRPDAAGVFECDIAPVLQSVLLLSTSTADRLKNTYVKYQGIWDGGSYAVVSLTTDIIYFYVGNNHYLNFRSKFHCTVADLRTAGQIAASNFPTGVSLIYEHTSDEVSATSGILTSALGHYATLGYSAVFEFLHDNTFSANCTVFFVSPTGVVGAATNFAGNVFAMRQHTQVLNELGQWSVQVKDVTAGNWMLVKRFTVVDPCIGIRLQWINDYGGLERLSFYEKQDITLSPLTQNKAFMRRAYVEPVQYSQWLMLSELLRDGQIYNDDRRIGQFVQDITVIANPVNVIPLPEETFTRSQQLRHLFSIQIRYPVIPNSGVS